MFYFPEAEAYSASAFHMYVLRLAAKSLRKEIPNWAREDRRATDLIIQYFMWGKVWIAVVIVTVLTTIIGISLSWI
jgi:hypothetical protein